jgi:hypothetical protein
MTSALARPEGGSTNYTLSSQRLEFYSSISVSQRFGRADTVGAGLELAPRALTELRRECHLTGPPLVSASCCPGIGKARRNRCCRSK